MSNFITNDGQKSLKKRLIELAKKSEEGKKSFTNRILTQTVDHWME